MPSARVRRHLLTLAAALLVAACQGTAPAPDRSPAPAVTRPFTAALPHAAAIEAYLARLASSGRLDGSVLVARGAATFTAAYGWADRTARTKDTVGTAYRLGSVTKQFTAMAVLILAQRHRLSLTDRVCTYLANCPGDWAAITLDELLTHTSGIPDYLNELGYPWPPRDVDPAGLIGEFRDAPLTAPPGTRMRYSNSGYALLGYVIERVTGKPYAEALEQLIFRPLGMTHTGVDMTAIRPGHAVGYYADGSRADGYPMSAFYSAGAVYSTVADIQIWDAALDGDVLLPDGAMRDLLRVHVPCPPARSPGGCVVRGDVGYGYGWFVARTPEGTLDYHVGHIDGFLTVNADYRAGRMHVVVLSNDESTDVVGIMRTLAGMA